MCKVIRRAWQLLIDKPPDNFLLHSADEDTITQMMVEIIENRLRKTGEVDGFDSERFGKVIREPKITNFDKEHPDKMPDIFFDLKRDQTMLFSEQDGLFVECKPIDRSHSILSHYCNKGLIRFVIGDYAWAMQDAMMVGYIKGDSSFRQLSSVFDDSTKSATLKTTQHSEVTEFVMYRSKHKREFQWPERRGQDCQISIAHLWLSA